ncbi:MAG: hypothetical protein ACE5I1_14885 [bacterium]
MSTYPAEITLELSPRSRFDVIDVRERVREHIGNIFDAYQKAFYCSFHTTAGYFEQSFCARLNHDRQNVDPLIKVFRKLFPAGADYRHDQMQFRSELTEAQKVCEPRNGDSHLIFISSGLKNCVTYNNQPDLPVYFIDLDGVYEDQVRNRKTSILAYDEESVVHKTRIAIPVSNHPIDSINLKDGRCGFIEELEFLLDKLDIQKGQVHVSLAHEEKNAGLTVNEYETLLMRHDLAEVLRNPVKFMAQQGKHMLLDPLAIPSKTIDYAKYDLVHVFNELMDAFKISSSVVEKILSKFIAYPAERFLRMKRGISLFASNGTSKKARIVQGTYQSPVLVQWEKAENRTRYLDVVISEFR